MIAVSARSCALCLFIYLSAAITAVVANDNVIDKPTLNPLQQQSDFIYRSTPGETTTVTPGEARTVKPGVLVVATDRLSNPALRNTVILIVRHLTSGTRGIVINRPTPLILGEIKVDLAGLPGDTARVHFGGPDKARTIRYLVRGPRTHAAEARITDDVWFGTRDDVLDDAANTVPGHRLRLYAGHVGWAPGALEQQLSRGDWLIAPTTTATLFNNNPAALWERLVKSSRRNDLVHR